MRRSKGVTIRSAQVSWEVRSVTKCLEAAGGMVKSFAFGGSLPEEMRGGWVRTTAPAQPFSLSKARVFGRDVTCALDCG